MVNPKFKELILYVAQESEFDPSFGAAKLNKILFFSDFLHYREHGTSITGETYFKLEHGPAPRAMVPAIRELEAEGACLLIERTHHGYVRKRLLVKREANLDLFTAKEIAHVGSILRLLRDRSASEVSDLSHHFIGWKTARTQEDIPYETVFLEDPEDLVLTEEEILYGQQLARELGV
jgi:uncharacterized phage-associated protein